MNVETIYSGDGKRRITIFRRSDGAFSYREEYHFINDVAQVEGWASLPQGSVLFGSLEIARRELPFNVAWLAEERRAGQQAVRAM